MSSKNRARRKLTVEQEALQSTNRGKIDRTTAGLRNALFDELDDLRSGDSNPQKARATALLANTVLSSVETEIEFHKYVRDVAAEGVDSRPPVLSLGTKSIELS